MCWADLASFVLLCGKKISASGVAFGEVCDLFLETCSAVFLAQCVLWCLHLLSNWAASSGDLVVDHSMNEPTGIARAVLWFWLWWIAKSSAFTEVTCPAGVCIDEVWNPPAQHATTTTACHWLVDETDIDASFQSYLRDPKVRLVTPNHWSSLK